MDNDQEILEQLYKELRDIMSKLDELGYDTSINIEHRKKRKIEDNSVLLPELGGFAYALPIPEINESEDNDIDSPDTDPGDREQGGDE